jgi:L-asparagine transporter-like permease
VNKPIPYFIRLTKYIFSQSQGLYIYIYIYIYIYRLKMYEERKTVFTEKVFKYSIWDYVEIIVTYCFLKLLLVNMSHP